MILTVTPAGDLSRLHGIVEPPPPPLVPQTAAWWILLGSVVVLLALAVLLFLRRRRRNRYRRVALRALEGLRADAARDPAGALPRLAVLVKRTALTAYPRDEVASLSGEEWLAFLDTTGGGGEFSRGPGRMLGGAIYRPAPDLPEAEIEDLLGMIDHWIRRHRVRV